MATCRTRIRIDLAARTALALVVVVVACLLAPGTAGAATSAAGAGRVYWSNPATWNGAPPTDTDAVTIAAGTTVVLDTDAAVGNLTIHGALEFARRDLSFAADWIHVEGGALRVGTASRPFRQRAVIQLRDRTPGESMGHLGDKFIGLHGGTLDLHGQPRRSWTRLVRTATRGQRAIVLASTAGWRAGDRIAIASTDFDSRQAEERTIVRVRGRVVTLDRPLRHTHFGVRQKIAGRWLDERAEVALLSRNVRIEGDPGSERTRVGGQVMAMAGSKLRIANVELTRMGQEGILLRYPIHFHMLGGAGQGSYVRNASIHHTWNRCLTIHGTDFVRATGNACVDHIGHGYFLEDGAERGNVLVGNLGFGTQRPRRGKAILDSDRVPATFWITNPDNVVRGNVAAGGEGHGIWIALPDHPTGLFARLKPGQARAMWPRRMRLRSFVGNVAHSNDRDGLHFDDGPREDTSTEATWHEAHVDPADEDSRTIPTTMIRLTAYKNRDHGAWLRGGQHRIVASVLADNAIGATFASDETFLRTSLVVGESANVGEPQGWEIDQGGVGRGGRSLPKPWEPRFPIRGFEFYDGRVGVEQTWFANFLPYRGRDGRLRQQSAIGSHLDNDFSIHPRNFARAVRFVRAKRVHLERPQVGHDGDRSAVFLDVDGSVSGRRGRSIMARNPFLYGRGCRLRRDFNAMECSGDYASLLVEGDSRHAVRPVRITRAGGAVQVLRASGGGRDASTTILANRQYRVDFNGGAPQRAKFVLRHGRDRWVTVAYPTGPGFRVERYGCDVGDARSWCSGRHASRAALDASTSAGYYYDAGAGMLYLRLVSTDTDWDELVVVQR